MSWVANPTFWVGYIADLGPYTGPWPPPVPPPQALSTGAGEIDYVIGVPDGSSASGLAGDAYLDLYRFWHGTPGDYFTTGYTYADSGVTPGDPANHLFVTFYDTSFADPGTYSPSVAPESLAPSWLAASGTLAVPDPPVAPSWTVVPDGAGWGTGFHYYVADLGPYTGPWPPAPPIPANLPYNPSSVPFPPIAGNSLHVDYVLTADAISTVIDGSYDGYDLFRYEGATVPIGSMLGSTHPPISGQHLFVLVDMPAAGAPPFSPLSVAPPLYVDGGLGVQLGDPASGSWGSSFAYPAGLEASPSFTITNPGYPKSGLMTTGSTPGHVSPIGLETTATSACYAIAPSNPSSNNGRAGFGIGFQTGIVPSDFTQAPFGVDDITQTDLRLSDNWGYNLFAVQNLDGDAAGAVGIWGIEGIDYVALPDGSTMTVASVDSTVTAWQSWVSLSVDYTAAAAFNSDNYLIGKALYGTTQFGWYLLAGHTASNVWLLDASGTPVATTNVTVATNANHTTSSVASTEIVDLSSSPISCQVTIKPMDISVGVAPLDLDTSGGDPGSGATDIDWHIHPDSMTATASIAYSDLHFWTPPTPVYPPLPPAVAAGYWGIPLA